MGHYYPVTRVTGNMNFIYPWIETPSFTASSQASLIMRCALTKCGKTKNINPSNSLCPSCEKTIMGSQRRTEQTERQQAARSQSHDQHRNLTASPAEPVGPSQPSSGATPPNPNNGAGYSNLPSSPGSAPASSHSHHPMMDMTSLQSSYSEMLSAGSQPKIFTDMFGMLLHVVSKQTENNSSNENISNNTMRIAELESKVGGPECISEKLGIALRNLPFPSNGESELENARNALFEVNAPGVVMMRDVLKAERVGSSESYLGTVKVEMKDDISRASIMKNKRNLEFHNNPHMRNLIVKNLKSENQMTIENFARDLLKMIPGGTEVFMAANGHLRQRASPGQSYQGQYSAQLPAAP